MATEGPISSSSLQGCVVRVDVVHVDIDGDVVDVDVVDVHVQAVDVDALFCRWPLCLLLCSWFAL